MRARFHPTEGQLYTSGCAVWATNCQTPGGFYRVRYNGQPAHLPVKVRAHAKGLALTFSEPLNPNAAAESARFQLKTWHYRRSEKYGSEHLDEKPSKVTRTALLDPTTVLVEVEAFAPTQSYELSYDLLDASGVAFNGKLHGTIHLVGAAEP
jgi:hypothetical protein